MIIRAGVKVLFFALLTHIATELGFFSYNLRQDSKYRTEWSDRNEIEYS